MSKDKVYTQKDLERDQKKAEVKNWITNNRKQLAAFALGTACLMVLPTMVAVKITKKACMKQAISFTDEAISDTRSMLNEALSEVLPGTSVEELLDNLASKKADMPVIPEEVVETIETAVSQI